MHRPSNGASRAERPHAEKRYRRCPARGALGDMLSIRTRINRTTGTPPLWRKREKEVGGVRTSGRAFGSSQAADNPLAWRRRKSGPVGWGRSRASSRWAVLPGHRIFRVVKPFGDPVGTFSVRARLPAPRFSSCMQQEPRKETTGFHIHRTQARPWTDPDPSRARDGLGERLGL